MWVDGEGSGKDGGNIHKARVEGLELDGIGDGIVLIFDYVSNSFENNYLYDKCHNIGLCNIIMDTFLMISKYVIMI